MAFWKCYYHVVWAVKNREPLINSAEERICFDAIRQKSESLNASLEAINGIQDHVHVVACIPPTLAVAEWIKLVKGVSSRALNEAASVHDARFHWQAGYGVFTVGVKHLPIVVAYVEQQKVHHAANTLIASLERTSE